MPCLGSAFKLANMSNFFQDLEVKSLLLEAYVKGQQELLYVVPFVAKVLESSLRSMVSNKCRLYFVFAITLSLLKFCVRRHVRQK